MSVQGEVPDLPVLSFNDFDEDVRMIEASSSSHNEELNYNRSGELNSNRTEVIAVRGNDAVPTNEE